MIFHYFCTRFNAHCICIWQWGKIKEMKKISSFIAILLVALGVSAQSQTASVHVVQSGETLSSIARNYSITVADLLKLNPDLNPDYIMAGQKIKVALVAPTRPQYKMKHEVQKKETIYGIAHQYGVTEQALLEANPQLKKGKLKKGEIINIPYTVTENDQWQAELKKHDDEVKRMQAQMYDKISAAVILPFALGSDRMNAESQKMANLYQGFLLAVDSLKQRGCSVDIYAYDESTEGIDAILGKPMLKNCQLIIGPGRNANVGAVAKFAHANGITHVVPMANDVNIVNERPTTFQINVPNAILYSQVYNRFISMHKDDNIIFLGMNDKNDNVSYITDFKKALDSYGVKYDRVAANEFSTIKGKLRTGVRNVLIPSSNSVACFENVCNRLNELSLDEYSIQLFGYPEWQTFADKHEKNFAKYRCQFFTSFYSNAHSSRNRQFASTFKRWFKQDQFNSYPHYGELGYDIGAFFVKGISEYGSALANNIHNVGYMSMEFPMNFEKKNSWSGYQNKSLLIVTYSTNGGVSVR